MKQTDSSPLFPTPFGAQADSGTLTPIPATKTTIGRASLALGFPKETFIPIAAGGVPPYGEDMNGILNMLSQAVRASEAGLIRPFSASYAQQIGGYPRGALVSDPANPSRLFLSTSDDNSAAPTQGTSNSWFSLTEIANDKLSRTGDTTSGNITYQSATAAAPWAATPQAIFGFEGSRGLGSLWGQLDSAGNYQLVLFARNTDGSEKAWGFRAVDGKVATPSGHLLLEADDTGNGRVTVQNIGSASGKTLATLDDVSAERQRAQDAEAIEAQRAEAAENTKLSRAGDTVSGNLIYESDGAIAAWASTPQTIFRFQNSKALGAIFGQMRSDGNFQTLLYAQNVDGSTKAWGFRSNDGHVATPGGHVLLEADDAGNGRVTVQNIGSASGNTLALLGDVTAETARAEAAENTKLSRFGDTSSGNITFNSGNAYQPWAASPQALFSIGGGLMSLWSQVDGENNIQMLLGGNNPGQPYGIPWVFNQAHKTITSPSGNILLEVAGASQPMKIQSFIATTDNGFTVSFPQAFSGTPTSININALEYNWDVGAKAGTWTPTGFRVSYYSSNTKGAPQQVSIIAIGPA